MNRISIFSYDDLLFYIKYKMKSDENLFQIICYSKLYNISRKKLFKLLASKIDYDRLSFIYNYFEEINLPINSEQDINFSLEYDQILDMTFDFYAGKDNSYSYKIDFFNIDLLEALNKVINNFIEGLSVTQKNVCIQRIINNNTLQEIGNRSNVTKESVRQVEIKTISLFTRYMIEHRHLISELKNELQIHKVIKTNTIIVKLLSHKKFKNSFLYDSDFDALVLDEEFLFSKITDFLLKKIKHEKKLKLTKKELIDILISYGSLNLLLCNQIINIMIRKKLLKIYKEFYTFPKLYLSKRACFVDYIRSLKKPIHIYKNIDKIRSDLSELFPHLFDVKTSDRNITTFTYDHNLVLWDWGIYIHIDNIKEILSRFDFESVIIYLNTQFNYIDMINLESYYKENIYELENLDIPSHYAIHSMLKYKYPDIFTYADSPWIGKKGFNKEQDLDDYITKIYEKYSILTLEDLSNKLKTNKGRLFQLLDWNKKVIKIDKSKYAHIKKLHLTDELIAKIRKWCDLEIQKLNFFNISYVLEAFIEELHHLYEYNKAYILLDILKKSYSNNNYYVTQDKIISISNKDRQFSALPHLFYKFEKHEKVKLDEIEKYFMLRGWEKKDLYNRFFYDNEQTYIRIDKENFVHKNNLTINDIVIKELISTIKNELIKYDNNEINIDELIIRTKLPKINIPWTKYTIANVLVYSEFEFYPSKLFPEYIKIKDI